MANPLQKLKDTLDKLETVTSAMLAANYRNAKLITPHDWAEKMATMPDAARAAHVKAAQAAGHRQCTMPSERDLSFARARIRNKAGILNPARQGSGGWAKA